MAPVLEVLADEVEKKRREQNSKDVGASKSMIQFVKPGQKLPGPRREVFQTSYLDQATDWQLKVDLTKQLKIPTEILSTPLRPDMIIYSRTSKKLGIIELTVPFEDRIGVSNELKLSKYQPLASETEWSVRVWAVEVGCRGFPAQSLSTFFKNIGIRGKENKRCLRRISSKAEEASSTLWKMSRVEKWGQK